MSNCADRVGLQPLRLVAAALHVARAAARTNLHRRDALPAGARLQAATLVMLSVAEWRSRPRVVGSHHTRCADAPAAAQRVAHDFRGGADRCVPRLRPEPPALVRAPAGRRRRERARRLFSDHHRRVRLALAVLAICVTSRGVQNCARAAARKMRRREATNGAGQSCGMERLQAARSPTTIAAAPAAWRAARGCRRLQACAVARLGELTTAGGGAITCSY